MKKIILSFVSVVLLSLNSFADLRMGLMLGISPLYMAKLDGTGLAPNNYELIYGSSAEFGIDIWNVNKQSWGLITGLQISGKRELTEGEVNGVKIDTTTPSDKIGTSFAYVGGAYLWQQFYIPVGMTYGMTKYETVDAATTADVKSGIGFLFGFGYFITENFAIEYIGRSALTTVTFKTGSTSEEVKGVISAPLLNIKYFF